MRSTLHSITIIWTYFLEVLWCVKETSISVGWAVSIRQMSTILHGDFLIKHFIPTYKNTYMNLITQWDINLLLLNFRTARSSCAGHTWGILLPYRHCHQWRVKGYYTKYH